MSEKEFNFSPYDCHRHIMDNMEQKLAFKGGDVDAWQKELGAKVKELLGWNPEERVDLNVRSLWKQDHDLGTIEKIVFTSEPFADVTAYMCLPGNIEPPYTTLICVQGHSTGMHNSIGRDIDDETKPIEIAGDRDFAIGCLKNGTASLCIEQRAFGYREEKTLKAKMANNRCWDATMHALMLGRTLIGERVYDIDRGIDYLLTRDDVDPDRIGVMGNSGGGTASVFSAAVLDRLAFAMPSCYFCTFRDSIMSIGHCMDNYIPHLLQYAEMGDVLGLFAPRPLVVVAGEKDEIFPVHAVKSEFQRLKEIYKAAGAEDKCHLVIGAEGHRFYADDAWPVLTKVLENLG